jgi:superfamily II DNA or RNA helicase
MERGQATAKMKTITILANAVTAKLHEPDRDAKLLVQTALSYTVAGHENTMLFKTGRWDGKSSFLDFKKGTFPAGFVHFVTAHLKRDGYEVRLVRKPMPAPLGPENPVVDEFPEDPRYDYQPEVVRRLVKHGQIIAQVATGGGKSRIARLAFARINRPTLFLTTRSVLMYQMKDTFEKDLKQSVSVLGDGQFGHTIVGADGRERSAIKKMSVGMVQTLVARLAEPDPKDTPEKQRQQALLREQTINLLSKFEFVILEEAHEAGGNSYYDILRHCINAHYRLALTATPFMRSDEEANMRLMASSGPIAIRVSEQTLIERGILARPIFKFVQLHTKPEHLMRNTAWQAAYRLGIVQNEERNQAIAFEAHRAVGRGLTVMALVQHKKHGERLMELLEARGLRASFIQGEDDQVGRKRALQALSSGKLDVLIGTTILDVGVDVPAVGMVILAGGGKAEVALRQRVGRGLRAKKAGPNTCFIVDFEDRFNENLMKHAKQRREIVSNTPGFAEGILLGGADFDYDAEGFPDLKKAA